MTVGLTPGQARQDLGWYGDAVLTEDGGVPIQGVGHFLGQAQAVQAGPPGRQQIFHHGHAVHEVDVGVASGRQGAT